MSKLKIAQGIAVLSILVGIMVIIGWYLDITILTSILPQWIRMKFATALCFIFSGIIIFFMADGDQKTRDIRQVILTIFPMILILVMGTLFLGSIFDFQTGMESIAFVDRHEVITPIFQGRPSVATMVCFLLIAIVGLLFNFRKATKKSFTIIGSTVGALGTLGIIGYIIGMPYLYYEIPGFSNAIAVHTTILFSILGLSLLLIGKNISK